MNKTRRYMSKEGRKEGKREGRRDREKRKKTAKLFWWPLSNTRSEYAWLSGKGSLPAFSVSSDVIIVIIIIIIIIIIIVVIVFFFFFQTGVRQHCLFRLHFMKFMSNNNSSA
jgi:heme/copper-type cytochrome/quinol oxidase subunit 2